MGGAFGDCDFVDLEGAGAHGELGFAGGNDGGDFAGGDGEGGRGEAGALEELGEEEAGIEGEDLGGDDTIGGAGFVLKGFAGGVAIKDEAAMRVLDGDGAVKIEDMEGEVHVDLAGEAEVRAGGEGQLDGKGAGEVEGAPAGGGDVGAQGEEADGFVAVADGEVGVLAVLEHEAEDVGDGDLEDACGVGLGLEPDQEGHHDQPEGDDGEGGGGAVEHGENC